MYRQYVFEAPGAGRATTADEAARLAGEIGFPVALKIASPDILHKTDIGGVILGVRTEDDKATTASRRRRGRPILRRGSTASRCRRW
jgi:acyl-CoA synthetase (NDP forming)